MDAYKKCKYSRIGFASLRSLDLAANTIRIVFFKNMVDKLFIISVMHFVIFEIIKQNFQGENIFRASGWFIDLFPILGNLT